MPRFMSKHLKKQIFSGNKNVYFIFTSGGYCGISGQLAKWMFRKKKMKYMGRAEFKMPRNYVANDSYPMLAKEEVEERIINSHKMLNPVAETIKAGGKLKARHIFSLKHLSHCLSIQCGQNTSFAQRISTILTNVSAVVNAKSYVHLTILS